MTTVEGQAPEQAPARRDVFGAVHLGYLVVNTDRFADWRPFGADAIGLHVDELTRDIMRFRLDEHVCRALLHRSAPARTAEEDATALGWLVDDHETFETILARVHDAGQPIGEGTPEECALRGVERLWRFAGPNGLATEIFTRASTTTTPLRMLQTGFVTGDGGMGHVALTARRPEDVRGYYQDVFDARLSDWVTENIAGLALRIRFLRVNERHHSVAVAGLKGLPLNPIRTRIQHLNTQVETLDDMLAAYQRVIDHGFRMQWSVGQHTNDRELSFYCVTPSGFEWELGWDPIIITPELEAQWAPRTYDSISIWGHKQIGNAVADRLAGDAAHMTPQFIGQGMNAGIRDADNLSWKLADVIHHRLDPSNLETYESERRPHAKAMIDLSVFNKDLVSTGNRSLCRLRDVGLPLASRMPLAGDFIKEAKMKPRPRFRSGYLGMPRGRRLTRSPEGTLFPQPRVSGTRLDDLLGSGWAVIGIGVDSREAIAPEVSAPLTPTLLTLEPAETDADFRRWLARHGLRRGSIVVLRPDRYVLTATRPGDHGRAAAFLARLCPSSPVSLVSPVLSPVPSGAPS